MGDKTINERSLSPEEVAERLRELADEIEDGDGANIRVGNKTISLSPATTIGFEIGVRERSSLLRGDRESVTVKLDWKAE